MYVWLTLQSGESLHYKNERKKRNVETKYHMYASVCVDEF